MGVERCDGCRFWTEGAGDPRVANGGTCRRHAPQPGQSGVRWPITSGYDWCGEWLAKVVELTEEQRRELAAGHIVNLG